MSHPSPTAVALTWTRGISDGETGADAPRLDCDELCALYLTARGIGLQRSGRVIPQREPMRLEVPTRQVAGSVGCDAHPTPSGLVSDLGCLPGGGEAALSPSPETPEAQ